MKRYILIFIGAVMLQTSMQGSIFESFYSTNTQVNFKFFTHNNDVYDVEVVSAAIGKQEINSFDTTSLINNFVLPIVNGQNIPEAQVDNLSFREIEFLLSLTDAEMALPDRIALISPNRPAQVQNRLRISSRNQNTNLTHMEQRIKNTITEFRQNPKYHKYVHPTFIRLFRALPITIQFGLGISFMALAGTLVYRLYQQTVRLRSKK
jgi:hypothetical protein